MAANYYPDGLTIEVITALQQEVDAEPRAEGHRVPPARLARTWLSSYLATGSTKPGAPTDTVDNPAGSREAEDEESVAAQPPARAGRVLTSPEDRYAA